MKEGDRWQPATVIDKYNPWSYVIKTLQGQVYQRNRWHLRRARNHNTIGENEINDSWLDNDIINDDYSYISRQMLLKWKANHRIKQHQRWLMWDTHIEQLEVHWPWILNFKVILKMHTQLVMVVMYE